MTLRWDGVGWGWGQAGWVALTAVWGGSWRLVWWIVNDVFEGHVGLDLECFDRIYLNGWVSTLQVPGQAVGFLTRHLGFPIPSRG